MFSSLRNNEIFQVLRFVFRLWNQRRGWVWLVALSMMAATVADLLEEIILVWILPKWTANVKGIFWIMRDKRSNRG